MIYLNIFCVFIIVDLEEDEYDCFIMKLFECFLYIFYYIGVLVDFRNVYYKKSSVRSNVLLVFDLDVLNGWFICVKCVSFC